MIRHYAIAVLLMLSHFEWADGESPTEWNVAVFQHQPIYQCGSDKVSKAVAQSLVNENFKVLETQTQSAARKGSKMIVFPEYGLFSTGLTRDAVQPYAEDIPSPNGTFCPCSQNKTNFIIQYRLSCLAKNNDIYVAATSADRKLCTGAWKASCPSDGQWLFNTAVAYNPQGCLVARYHKQHLYKEHGFNTPPKVELSTFETEYGKFGLSICFDILFKEPMMELVEKEKVDVVVFPTAWMDALPFLPAIGFHSGWAWGTGSHVLASNLNIPVARMYGSGIYGPQGNLAYVFTSNVTQKRLILATLPPRNNPVPDVTPMPFNHKAANLSDNRFVNRVFGNYFNFTRLVQKRDVNKVCHGAFCCYLRYEMSKYHVDEIYAFGAFSGLHMSSGFNGGYFLQVCILVRCNGTHANPVCRVPRLYTKTRFNSFYIDGTFSNKYVFPVVFSNNMTLPKRDEVQYGRQQFPFLQSRHGMSEDIGTASLVGRIYEKDTIKKDNFRFNLFNQSYKF